MALFVIACLAFFVVAYLVTVAVQVIRIEKTVVDTARFVEERLAATYRGEEYS
ncbi:MAG: hypothetical protein GF418_13575 [Chitinivibrionales bacterium]|nr:hypothetical protein [Chitinivibrionales bacterium]MBD3396650.1 hypothetical protein [Chitinivibrionales bacterium]